MHTCTRNPECRKHRHTRTDSPCGFRAGKCGWMGTLARRLYRVRHAGVFLLNNFFVVPGSGVPLQIIFCLSSYEYKDVKTRERPVCMIVHCNGASGECSMQDYCRDRVGFGCLSRSDRAIHDDFYIGFMDSQPRYITPSTTCPGKPSLGSSDCRLVIE